MVVLSPGGRRKGPKFFFERECLGKTTIKVRDELCRNGG